MTTLNDLQIRRKELRKLLIVNNVSDAERTEYMIIEDRLIKATKDGTVGRNKVDGFFLFPDHWTEFHTDIEGLDAAIIDELETYGVERSN